MYIITILCTILAMMYIFTKSHRGYASEDLFTTQQDELSTSTDISSNLTNNNLPLLQPFTSNQIVDLTFAADTSY